MVGFFRSWRRRSILSRPFPPEWRDILRRNVGWYSLLSTDEQRKLERDAQVLIAEKNWEGCAGLAMTDEIKVTIAGQAALLVLTWTGYLFERVQTVLVYPASYRARVRDEVGVDLPSDRSGEAMAGGPVVLSWRDSLGGARGWGDGHNVVLHEFAHVLDMENGDSDGVPWLDGEIDEQHWRGVVQSILTDLQTQVDRRRPTFLEPYAATNAAEFFAVSTEAFFETPGGMREVYPEFYSLLTKYYRQDPAERMDRCNAAGTSPAG